MKYLPLIYSDEKDTAAMLPAERDQWIGTFMAYSQALKDANVLRGGNRLRPTSAATSVRIAGGKTQTVDGTFAETRDGLLDERLWLGRVLAELLPDEPE